jgi:hypothetical protein
MAGGALLVFEERRAALGLRRDRRGVPALPAIVGRIERDEFALEGGKRQRDRVHVDLAIALGEGGAEQFRIAGLVSETLGERAFGLAAEPHLDGDEAFDRDQRLMLQRVDLRPAPGEGVEPGQIGQRLDVALAGGAVKAFARLVGIGEAARLLVTGGAAHRAIPGEVGVVEQAAAEFDLHRRRRVGGGVGRGEVGGGP